MAAAIVARRVLLVGYQDQDNLGLRYLSGRLLRDGHATRIVSFGEDAGPLLHVIREWEPDLVGFSLIFQYMVPQFGKVMRALRLAGVTSHFTVGGHYASFEPEALLQAIPDLDSVVRFEGEEALAEIVKGLDAEEGWRNASGIAHRRGGAMVLNGPREGSIAIDDYADADRRDIDYRSQALPTASVLAARGCPWKCSFCSIITFYEGNGTQGRRRRDPVRVVDEMEDLVRERGVRLILMQDDDFIAGGKAALLWSRAIADDLIRRGLHREMRFKIACRSDEVSVENLEPLARAGLCHVYLGVESGDESNLKSLNKLLKPEVHERAGKVLRQLNLSFDFGFMLLEPWSTLATARNNLAFLRRFTQDGWVVAGFCRALPYVGTPMEKRLRAEGRMTGSMLEAEYQFLDPRLDLLWNFCLLAYEGRNYGSHATWNVLRGLRFDAHFDLPGVRPFDAERDEASRLLVQAHNEVLGDSLESAIDLIESGDANHLQHPELLALARFAREEDQKVRRQLAAMERKTSEVLYEALFR